MNKHPKFTAPITSITPTLNWKNQQKSNKKDEVFAKYNGHCAYCGCNIDRGCFHIDHVIPKRRYKYTSYDVEVGSDEVDNLLPSCASCNSCKSDLSVEQFRARVEDRITRLNNTSSEYNIAKRFGLIVELSTKVEFYFEKIDKQKNV